MNSMLIGGHLTHTHCIPCVMNSMYAWLHVCRVPCTQGSMLTGFLCAGFHAYRVPCLPCSMLARFYLLWILVRRVPCLPGSSYVGFHAYRAPFVTGSCTQVSRVSGSKHAGFHLLPVLVLRVLPVMNSNHAGLQSHWLHAHRVLCVMNYCVLYCAEGSMSCEFLCAEFHARRVPCFMNSMLAGL